MLKINRKVKIPLIITCVIFGGVFLFQYLTFVPEYSQAQTIDTVQPANTLEEITSMQEMTAEVCRGSKPGSTKRLVDERDSKAYWVAKMQDGNCWMLQNLDLDLNGRTLTSSDSDVENWKSTTGGSKLWTSNIGDNAAAYFDAGMYVYSTPADLKYCGGIKSLSSCSSIGWVNVVNMLPSDGAGPENVIDGTVYDAHYLVGNHYSWVAATAGQTSVAAGGDATQSICPKGWMLPRSGTDSEGKPLDVDKSFTRLLQSYGWQWVYYDDDWQRGGYWASEMNGGTDYDARKAPFYFLYGGLIYNNSINSPGSVGYYWTSTAATTSTAYALSLTTQLSSFDKYYTHYAGSSVRCVNRGDSSSGAGGVEIDNPNVSVGVPNMITLDVANVVDLETASGKISEKEFVATVSSNSEYNITISATKDGHTDLRNEEGKIGSIEALAEGEELKENVSKWGLKCVKDNKTNNNANCMENTKSFVGLTEYNNPRVYFKSPSGGMNQEITFQVGIGVGSELSSGVYSTNILVTAATGN